MYDDPYVLSTFPTVLAVANMERCASPLCVVARIPVACLCTVSPSCVSVGRVHGKGSSGPPMRRGVALAAVESSRTIPLTAPRLDDANIRNTVSATRKVTNCQEARFR